MEEFKGMPPLLGRLECNLVKIGILEKFLNPSTMNNLEGIQHNSMHLEGLHSIATIVAWKGTLR